MTSSGLSLGIDLGTGSVKTVLLDRTGKQVCAGSAPVKLNSPRTGWVESDPEDWWAAVGSAVQQALNGRRAYEVVAIGLSGQMHGVVLCEQDSTPLRPAVVSLDRRALADLSSYRMLTEDLLASLGNPLVPGAAGPILHWLARHELPVLKRAAWALQPKDWLRLRLIEQAGSEPSDASGTLLFDLTANTWAWKVMDALGLPASLLPPLGEPGRAAGKIGTSVASSLGLRAGVPVAFGAADTAAALLGTALPRRGAVQLTVGSAAQVLTLREKPTPDHRLRYHVFASAEPGTWYALAAVQVAGVALSWVLEAFGASWEEAYRAIELSPPGSRGVLFVPHLAGARSPRMDSAATGGFFGIELAHNRADLLRATFEGVAFSIAEAAEVLPEIAGVELIYLAGGGALQPSWRQLLSDALGKRLLVVSNHNASAHGAALLGWQATDHKCNRSLPDVSGTVTPDEASQERLAEAFGEWKTVAAKMTRSPQGQTPG